MRVLGVEYGPGLGAAEKRGGPLQLRRHVGMVFQQFNLFPHLTALDNIARPLRSAKGHRPERGRERAAGALQQVGLLNWAAHYPGASSRAVRRSGSRSRARSSLDPKVMLFDEPTSALDPELVGEVLAVMRQPRRVRA